MVRLAAALSFFSATLLASQALDGVWRSLGYGYVFEINGPVIRAFEVTTSTCLSGFTARNDGSAVPGREATFRSGGGDVWFVRSGGRGDHWLLHNEGSASNIRIVRVPQLPASCSHPPANTPAGNFEVFTRTWAENYISFDLKHVDWERIVANNRSRLNERTSAAALFDLLAGMIQPFGDAHTFISAPAIQREFRNLRPGTDRVVRETIGRVDRGAFRKTGVPRLLTVTERAYFTAGLRTFCNHQLQYGHTDARTGYLRILSFSGYVPGGDYSAGLAALETALDEIFSDPALQALIIDVRINFGGDDPYGLAIASRLASAEYLAYTKYARADAIDRNRWTPGDPSIVRPSSRPGFRGPVVELIGPFTISAGETFTQALMGRVPHVTRIGENTQGVFSDVLVRRLPNGWIFGLPNEVYRTLEGTTFDGPGIPPDITVPVFAAADITSGRDPAMAKALEVLRKQ